MKQMSQITKQPFIAPHLVREAAEAVNQLNWRFATFLHLNADAQELDLQFSYFHSQAFAAYDCQKCGNCCRVYAIGVEDAEIEPIAAALGVSREAAIKGLMAYSDEEQQFELKAPCGLLHRKGTCRVYDIRPVVCRDYPYTNRPGAAYHLFQYIELAHVCPIVYELLEWLKGEYAFTGETPLTHKDGV